VEKDISQGTASNAEDCQAQCFRNNACTVWAFNSCGNECWLKNGDNGLDRGRGCRVSGVITANRNNPAPTPTPDYRRGLTLVNNCDHSIRMCGMYAAFVFDMPAKSSKWVGDDGNPAYNQCDSVQVELKFNTWNNFDWYDFSEVAIKWSGDPVKLIPPFGAPTLYCNQRNCPDAYQYWNDDTKTHAIKTGGAFVAQWC